MIVLDEQLLGRDLEHDIARWYRGPVRFIVDLRPHTVVKDEAIPELLRQQPQPTFVTINERDFWRKIVADTRYLCAFPCLTPVCGKFHTSYSCCSAIQTFAQRRAVWGRLSG